MRQKTRNNAKEKNAMRTRVDRELMNRITTLTEENARYKVAFDLLSELVSEDVNERLVYTSEVRKILGVAKREVHLINFVD